MHAEEVGSLADAPLHTQMAGLASILAASHDVRLLLEWAAGVDLPSWYLGAGAVAQTVWNRAHGFPPGHGIKDFDLVYFDAADLSREDERHYEALVPDALAGRVDITNQAGVHVWYAGRFGPVIEPYRTVEEAIGTWPSTASSVGVRVEGDRAVVCAPFGLRDLFALVVRPNKALVPRAVYEEKAARWQASWPSLRVEPW